MSDELRSGKVRNEEPANEPKGPNLTLLYSLIALALLAAIGLAVLIVRPFYLSR